MTHIVTTVGPGPPLSWGERGLRPGSRAFWGLAPNSFKFASNSE